MYRSSLGEVYKALRAVLLRDGIQVGNGAGYPRVEIHSLSESEPLDKGMRLRSVSCIIESMSTDGYGEAVEMNADNLARIDGHALVVEGFAVNGIMPGTLTELTETTDTQMILYRLLQNITIYLTQK